MQSNITAEVTLKAYAKINLALDVLYKRQDGFHEVTMIMQSVSLADDIRLEKRDEGITLHVDVPGLAADKTNLAFRAAALLKNTYGTCQKNSPGGGPGGWQRGCCRCIKGTEPPVESGTFYARTRKAGS